MLEGLAVVSAVGVGPASPASLRPPAHFRPTGEIRSAWRSSKGPGGLGAPKLRGTAAQKAGIRYERKVQAELSKLFGEGYEASPWFKFQEYGARAVRWCQPDGLLVLEDLTAIFEVKIRTMASAWWQLSHLYAPVIDKALRPQRLALVQIFRSFDPAVLLPGPHTLLPTLSLEVLYGVPPGRVIQTCVWRL